MNHTIPFATPGNGSSDSEHSQSTEDDLRRERDTPKLVACLLLYPKRSSHLSFLRNSR